MKRSVRWAAAVATLPVLALTACSSSSSGGAGGSDGPSGQKFTGSITVMSIAPATGQGATFPGLQTVADAFAKQVNASGGIGGKELKVEFCDDQNNPNLTAKCARQAVSDKVAAVVGSFSISGGSYMPVLQSAGIPYLSGTALSAQDFSSKLSYPVTSGPIGFAALGAESVKQGCTSLSVAQFDVPAAATGTTFVNLGRASQKGSPASVVKIAPTTTDYSAAAASLKNAKCILTAIADPNLTQLLSALQQQGSKARIFAPGGAITQNDIKTTPSLLDNAVFVSNFVPLSDPAWAAFKKATAGASNVDQTNAILQTTWVGYVIFQAIAKTLPTVSASTVHAALDKATSVDTGGLLPSLSFAKEFPQPGLNRLFETNIYVQVLKGGKASLLLPQPVNAAQFLAK